MNRVLPWLSAFLLASLAACGGGGGGGGSVASLATLSGTAAVGAPLAAAQINVFDSKGQEVGQGTSDDSGFFSIQLSKEGAAPYTLKLSSGPITLHAMHASAASGEVNITPLSDTVVAMLSPTGSAADMITALQGGAQAPTKTDIESKQDVLSAALSDVASAAGATQNVFTRKFSADGTGTDKLLDAIAINTVADGVSKKANVQIALKVATDTENPAASLPVLNLTSDTTTAQASTEKDKIDKVKPEDLPNVNAGKLYKDLVANLNACYKEAPNVRTDGESTVLSNACKKIFLDNDPAQYLNYGQRLGKNAQFAGMFTYTGEVQFKVMDKPYLVQDLNGSKRGDGIGRAIVGLSWVNEHGNRENISLYVTKYTLDGKELLGLSGDRNQYAWAVNSHNQKREFPLREDGSLDYVTSAYLIMVKDLVVSSKSVINYATVTSPSGKKILLAAAPGGAARDLAICKSSEVALDADNAPLTPRNTETNTYPTAPKYTCTGSKAITFSERFVASDETRKPSDIGNSGILRPLDSAGQPYTPGSDVVKHMPSISAWTIKYHFMNNTTATQKTWSVARPMTTQELMGPDGPDKVMPRYTTQTITNLKTLKTAQAANLSPCPVINTIGCVAAQSPIPAPTQGGFKFEWSTDNRVPVTSLWVSGWKNDVTIPHMTSIKATSWDDQLNVRSTSKSGEILCSRQSSSDLHCADAVAVNAAGAYHPKSWMTYSEMWGKDAEQRTHMRSYNWYQPRKADNTPF